MGSEMCIRDRRDMGKTVADQAEASMPAIMLALAVPGLREVQRDDALGRADLDMEGLVSGRCRHAQAMRHRQAALQAEHQGEDQPERAHDRSGHDTSLGVLHGPGQPPPLRVIVVAR